MGLTVHQNRLSRDKAMLRDKATH